MVERKWIRGVVDMEEFERESRAVAEVVDGDGVCTWLRW